MSFTINTGAYQKSSSGSGCSKVLLWLFFTALILSCLCCAGLLGLGFYLGNSLKDGLNEDPELAQQKVDETFGNMTLPENIKPQAVYTFTLFGKQLGSGSIYNWDVTSEDSPTVFPKETNSEDKYNRFIAFYSFSDSVKGYEKDMCLNISELIYTLSNKKNRKLSVKQTEDIPVTINGNAVNFSFVTMDADNNEELLTVHGSFVSKKGAVCNVYIHLPGNVSKETVISVLEKLQ